MSEAALQDRPPRIGEGAPVLEARGLHQIYRNGGRDLHVIRGVDLVVPGGKILAIVGKSGSGKSTLLHLLGGLQPPTRGEVFYRGLNFYELSEEERAHLRNEKIGFVFQFYHLLPELTALENVMLPVLIGNGTRRREAEDRAKELLTRLHLKERLFHRPNRLSGGEQQRVAIARSLIREPEVVLCDEPTGNLDSKAGDELCDLIRELNVQFGRSFLIVTHAERVASIAATVYQIEDGVLECR